MLFGNKQESNLRSCTKMIEEAIESLGHVAEASRLETKDNIPAWRVRKGSAHVYILIHQRDEKNYLRVTAPVMHLVATVDELKLYRRLLEVNAQEITGAAFALRDGDIVLTAERSTLDLDRSEVLDMIKRVEDYADHWDDLLVKEFGGRLAGLSAAPVK
jgi:hypothetical protein